MKNTVVLTDKGYDSNVFVHELQKRDCISVIPTKRNRKYPRNYDEHIYKERHLIDCFFGKIKYFRRVFLRFDKTAAAFLAFLYLVSVFIMVTLILVTKPSVSSFDGLEVIAYDASLLDWRPSPTFVNNSVNTTLNQTHNIFFNSSFLKTFLI